MSVSGNPALHLAALTGNDKQPTSSHAFRTFWISNSSSKYISKIKALQIDLIFIGIRHRFTTWRITEVLIYRNKSTAKEEGCQRINSRLESVAI